MTLQNFTQKSQEAIQDAQNLAIRNNHQQLEQIHLLAALLEQDGGLIPQLLKKMNVTWKKKNWLTRWIWLPNTAWMTRCGCI